LSKTAKEQQRQRQRQQYRRQQQHQQQQQKGDPQSDDSCLLRVERRCCKGEWLLVAHDVLPNYYNYVGKTKILINDNFFVVNASQLIKSITHNAIGGQRNVKRKNER